MRSFQDGKDSNHSSIKVSILKKQRLNYSFIKSDEQNQACLDYVMVVKRVFEEQANNN